MHIFTDGIKSISFSNNNLRIALLVRGSEQTPEDAGMLIIPVNQIQSFIEGLAGGVQELQEQVKARKEESGKAEES